MARYECKRCGEACFTTNEPHLCADVARRLRRREAQVQAVLQVYREQEMDEMPRGVAEAIVKKLAQMGVTED